MSGDGYEGGGVSERLIGRENGVCGSRRDCVIVIGVVA